MSHCLKSFQQVLSCHFVGLLVVVISHCLQLTPARRRLLLSKFASGSKINQLLSLQLWYLFEYTEFKKVAGKSDQAFVNVLNNVRLGTIDENTE